MSATRKTMMKRTGLGLVLAVTTLVSSAGSTAVSR